MILETWTESERTALKQIEVQLLHMFREGRDSNQLYDYLVTCQKWTSARVVIFAAILTGSLYEWEKTKRKQSEAIEADNYLNEKISKLFEAINLNFQSQPGSEIINPVTPKHRIA